MRKFLLFSGFFFLVCFSCSAQDFSSKGKEFWLAYSYHVGMAATSSGQPTMTLNMTSDQTTTYTVEIFGGAVIASGTITPNINSQITIPTTYFVNGDGLFTNRAIHVTAAKPIVIYAFQTRSAATGATLCLPFTVLGKEYYSMNYTQNSNEQNSNSYLTIVAVENGTTLEITPTVNTVGGWTPNSVHIVSLNKGEVYQVLGTTTGNSGTDLTGTRVRSIASGTGGCKRIAVFSGSGKLFLPGSPCTSSADNLYQQLYPVATWGKKYLTAPSYNRLRNYFRILRSDPLAVVKVNGVIIPSGSFTAAGYYEFNTSAPNLVESDLPISVSQYFTQQSCLGNGSPFDPDMIMLNPVEQNINKVTLISSNLTGPVSGHQHHIHVIIRNSGTALSSFLFDGAPLPSTSTWLAHPQDPNYSYTYITNISESSAGGAGHTMQSDSGFNALAYGYANAETYGYSAGTSVKDLYQQISVTTQYGIETSPSVCSNSPFKFKISLPYQPLQLFWDLTNLPAGTLPNHNNVTQVPSPTCPTTTTAVCYDSTTFVNGKQIWWYSLPTFYSIPIIGTFPITLTAQTSGTDGCGSEQEINFDLEVSNPPVADFTFTVPGCKAETVQFSDASITVKPNYHWYWDFDDPGSGAANISNLQNPTHLFTTSGPHNVRFSTITTPGCLSDTLTKIVNVPAQPNATISGATTVCVNAASPQITFTATGGTPPYTFTYNIDGGPAQTITTIGNSASASVSVPTSVSDVFIYSLTNVQNSPAALCTTPIMTQAATVYVNPRPTATVSGTATVCQNSTPPQITFTGSGGTAPYTFTYHIGSGPNQTLTTTAGNSISVTAPTGTTGTFNYVVTNVSDGSPTGCSNTVNAIATITVNPLPTATISGTTELCLNAPPPNITFTAAGGTAPYTFTYTLNSGTNQTIQTISGNSVTLAVPTSVAGTFNYTLIGVQESSGVACAQNQNGLATVTVDPKPTASFTTSTPFCEARNVTFTPAFSISSGSVVSWIWNYGDGTGSQTRTDGNPFNIAYATTGPKTVTFQTVSDKGCLSAVFTQVITINARPEAGFISPEVCLLDPFAQFTDTSKVAGGTITSWQWNFGDANATPGNPNTATTQNPTHVYTAVGTYTAQLIVFSNAGCSDTLQQQLTISAGNPQANFIVVNAAALCSNDSVAVQNKSMIGSGNITKLEIYWDLVNQPAAFDLDNVPYFDKIYKHKYPTSTTDRNYTVRMRSYSGNTCFSTKDVQITVHAAPVAQLNAIPDVCLNNGTVQFTQGSETGGVPGTGVYSGPGVSSTGVFNPLTAGAGLHTITYTTTTAFGCTDFKTTTVKVPAAPVAVFALTGAACQFSPTIFTPSATSTDGIITQWIWNFEGVNETHTLNEAVSHTFTTAGPQTVTLMVVTAAGCKSLVASQTITINPRPQPDFSFTSVACLPLAKIDFTNATPNISTWVYQWDFDYPGGGTSSAVNPSYTYTTVGPHQVRLTATSATTTCTNSIIKPVNSIHPAPRADFSFNKPFICTAQDVTVIDQSTFADGTPVSWLWNYGDGGTSSGQEQSPHIYTGDGVYNVTLNITNSFGCVDDTSIAFTVYPYPTVNAGPDQAVLEGGQSVLQGTATGNDLSFLWTPHMYLSNYTILTPIVKPLADITYTLTVTARGGCAKSDDVFIKVLKLPAIPNTFTPNNDGVHDTWEIKYLFQYPDNRVQVFTRTGQLVFESHGYSKPWDGTKGGKPLPFDTYYYIIEPNSGRAPLTGYVTIVK